MYNVQKHNICINIPLSKTFRSCVFSIFYYFVYTETAISGLGFKALFPNIIAISLVFSVTILKSIYNVSLKHLYNSTSMHNITF
jgi:hypothetical protein